MTLKRRDLKPIILEILMHLPKLNEWEWNQARKRLDNKHLPLFHNLRKYVNMADVATYHRAKAAALARGEQYTAPLEDTEILEEAS